MAPRVTQGAGIEVTYAPRSGINNCRGGGTEEGAKGLERREKRMRGEEGEGMKGEEGERMRGKRRKRVRGKEGGRMRGKRRKREGKNERRWREEQKGGKRKGEKPREEMMRRW